MEVVKCAHCHRLLALGTNCPSCGPGPVETLNYTEPRVEWELTEADRVMLRTNGIDPGGNEDDGA